jgi:hypothetical protein
VLVDGNGIQGFGVRSSKQDFSEIHAGNPNEDFENYVKIIEYVKLERKPELLYY